MNSQQRVARSNEFSHIGPAVRLCPARYVVLGTAGVHINPLSATWPGLGHVRPRNVLDSVNSVADFSLSPAYIEGKTVSNAQTPHSQSQLECHVLSRGSRAPMPRKAV